MKRKVVIVLEDSDEGFSRQMYVEPPLPENMSDAQPTPALICAMVVHRAIQAFVEAGEENTTQEKPVEEKTDDKN
jgi:hypothetical protein